MRWAVVLAWLVGCNPVFGIDTTTSLDAADPDLDHDGVLDDVDNCVGLANPLQSNDDGDALGNDCDNCPVITNPGQEDYDYDQLGDSCDPHPVTPGDCLLLVDSFDTMESLDHWTATSTGVAPVIEKVDGGVRITVPDGSDVNYLVDIAGPVSVQATGEFTAAPPSMMGLTRRIGVTAASTASALYRCTLSTGTVMGPVAFAAYLNNGPASNTGFVEMPSTKNSRLDFYLIPDPLMAGPPLRCRVSNGTSLGVIQSAGGPALTGGGAGVFISGQAPTFEGIAIIRYQPGTTCPEPVRR